MEAVVMALVAGFMIGVAAMRAGNEASRWMAWGRMRLAQKSLAEACDTIEMLLADPDFYAAARAEYLGDQPESDPFILADADFNPESN